MDSFIEEVVAIADAVAARRRSTKRIMLSFDEWNVWYRTRRNRAERVKPGWPVAPRHPRGSLHHGGCAGLRRRLHLAAQPRRSGEDRCLAQLVNVIAPIMTETGGPGLAADDLLSVRAVEQFRPRQGAAGRDRLARPTTPAITIRAASRICISRYGALSEAGGGTQRQVRDTLRGQSQPR